MNTLYKLEQNHRFDTADGVRENYSYIYGHFLQKKTLLTH